MFALSLSCPKGAAKKASLYTQVCARCFGVCVLGCCFVTNLKMAHPIYPTCTPHVLHMYSTCNPNKHTQVHRGLEAVGARSGARAIDQAPLVNFGTPHLPPPPSSAWSAHVRASRGGVAAEAAATEVERLEALRAGPEASLSAAERGAFQAQLGDLVRKKKRAATALGQKKQGGGWGVECGAWEGRGLYTLVWSAACSAHFSRVLARIKLRLRARAGGGRKPLDWHARHRNGRRSAAPRARSRRRTRQLGSLEARRRRQAAQISLLASWLSFSHYEQPTPPRSASSVLGCRFRIIDILPLVR